MSCICSFFIHLVDVAWYNYKNFMSFTLFIIEDDEDLREVTHNLLTENGYRVRSFPEGTSALKELTRVKPDLVILDLMLPNIDGEAICQEMKKKFPELPVIMLTGKNSKSDIVKGLNMGADDYVAKPFDVDELLARIKARLRASSPEESVLLVGDLSLNLKTLEVKRGERDIKLTPQEFRLLEYLMRNKNTVVSRDMILDRIWMNSADVETRVVDVYIGYLRGKIDQDTNKKLIHSVRGFGYTLKE